MKTLLLIVAFSPLQSHAQMLEGMVTAQGATASFREERARRQTLERLNVVCRNPAFKPRTEKAVAGCAYELAHARAQYLTYKTIDSANGGVGYVGLGSRYGYEEVAVPLGGMASDTESAEASKARATADERREKAIKTGAVKVTAGLDSINLEQGVDYVIKPGRDR